MDPKNKRNLVTEDALMEELQSLEDVYANLHIKENVALVSYLFFNILVFYFSINFHLIGIFIIYTTILFAVKKMCFNDRCGHGKCIEKTNTFTCVCTTGWTGKYCKKGYYNRLIVILSFI